MKTHQATASRLQRIFETWEFIKSCAWSLISSKNEIWACEQHISYCTLMTAKLMFSENRKNEYETIIIKIITKWFDTWNMRWIVIFESSKRNFRSKFSFCNIWHDSRFWVRIEFAQEVIWSYLCSIIDNR